MLGLGTNIIKANLYSSSGYTSANFDGTDDFFTVSDNDALSFSNSPGFGISVWLNLNDGVNHGILQKGEEYKLYIESNGRINWTVVDDSENKRNRILSNTGAFSFDEWVHLYLEFGLVSSNPQASMYINGVASGTISKDSGFVAPENTSADLLIGKASNSISGTFGTPNVVMNGNITNLHIYSGSLTSTERTDVYNANVNGSFSNNVNNTIVASYLLTSDINDSSGNGHNGSAASGQEPTFTTI
jgi:hypothetical protein